MVGRTSMSRLFSRPDSQSIFTRVGKICLRILSFGVLIFTVIIAACYLDNVSSLLRHTKITSFVTNATFQSHISIFDNGDNFFSSDGPKFDSLHDLANVVVPAVTSHECESDIGSPIDCADREVFQQMMMAAIEQFKNIHIYHFGKSLRGSNDSTCDLAWRYILKEEKNASFYKDYRRFMISRSGNCNYFIVGIGGYHSGVNARNKKKNLKQGLGSKQQGHGAGLLSYVEAVNNLFTPVMSVAEFTDRRYLIYMGGGERCKSMSHYLWSFTCALGEALYLNRTLVWDLSICLSSTYTESRQYEEGRDFRFYFDIEHLKYSTSFLDQSVFWKAWSDWQNKHGLTIHLVEDSRVTPKRLLEVNDSLIMRKFGSVEPDNYWYKVCEGKTESIIKRPWHVVRKSKLLMDIVFAIVSRLGWDFDTLRIARGKTTQNLALAADTAPEALLSTIRNRLEDGRHLYIATNEPDSTFYNSLKDWYIIHFLDEYNDLWDHESEWYNETKRLNNGIAVEFDGYMRAEVDAEIFLRGKKEIDF